MEPEVGFRSAIFATVFFSTTMFLIAVLLYILGAIGLYRIALKSGIEHPWFAFIPVLQFYTLGKLIGEIKIGNQIIPELELLLSIGFFTRYIPIFGWIFKIVWIGLLFVTFYELYKLYKEDKAILMLVISIITLGLAVPIFLFIMRNDEPWKKIESDQGS